MKPRNVLAFLIVLFLSACSYTFEIGMDHFTGGVATGMATDESNTVAPNIAGTPTSTPTDTVMPGLQFTNTLIPYPGDFSKTAPADGAITTADPTLSWTASSGASGYFYCYDDTNNNACDNAWISTGTFTIVNLGGLGNGTTYYWQARAVGSGVTTDADRGTWWSFTPQTATSATIPQATNTQIPSPGAFGKIAPVNGAGSSFNPTLSWSVSSGAKGYFYCYDTKDNNACDASWISTGTATSANLGSLPDDKTYTYYWQVRAANSGVTTDADGGLWWHFTTGKNSPSAFGKIAPADGAGVANNLTLSWSTSSISAYFYCYDTADNNTCDTSWIQVGTATSANLGGLPYNETYYWQVRAGNNVIYTEADGGTWWSFTTPSSAFSKTSPADGSSIANPTLSWTASSGAERYLFCFDTSNNNECDAIWNDVGASTAVSLSDKYGLASGTTYYWQVEAINSGTPIEANGGVWWSFTTPPGSSFKISPADDSDATPASMGLASMQVFSVRVLFLVETGKGKDPLYVRFCGGRNTP